MDVHLRTHLNNLSAFVTKELHRPERPRVLWEVYCGTARTSQVAEAMGMEVRRFSYETGWDFDRLDHQEQFLILLEEEQPDEVLVTPECKLWSRMQSLGRRTWHQQEALIAARARHHDRHLIFMKKVYMAQINGGRHATVEQPKHALSWRARALRDLPSRRADFSQCRNGAQCLDADGIWRPVRKDTTLLTSKRSVQDAMSLCCQKDHQHCHLEGAAPGYGSRTHYMEEYQPGLAATLAGALCIDEAPIHWETAYAGEEEKQSTGSLIKLKADTRQEAIRVVQRLHHNLGHPGPEALAELLAARGASESVINAAKGYVCTACAKYKRPAQTAPASTPKTKDFNALVMADVFWLRRGSTKFPILSMVDAATRYTAAILLKNEQSEQYIRAIEKSWISVFGPPTVLMTDEGRPWLGQVMDTWTTAHNIEHVVAPGEAHERLAIVERRHALIRRAVEIYLNDQHVDNAPGIKEALVYVIPQLNASPSVAGFSPAQWVLGHQPSMAGDLLADNTQAPQFGGNAIFEEMLTKRHAAKKALLDADADRRLRRALSLKYKGTNAEYSLGPKGMVLARCQTT